MDRDEPDRFPQVMSEEMEHITARRIKSYLMSRGEVNAESEGIGDAAIEPPDHVEVDHTVLKHAQEHNLVGLAFSGGGIRSATFSLGVLQGLADLGLLRWFDYLSTVSGGGYIGSWFAAWVKREGGLPNVEQQLKPDRTEQAKAVRQNEQKCFVKGAVFDKEPEPIYHLRAFSNYLAPRFSLLSADSWTLLAIYLRNLLLNQLVLLPGVMALLLLARCIAFFQQCPPGRAASERWGLTLGVLMLALVWAVFGSIVLALFRSHDARSGFNVRQMSESRLHFQILLPLLLAAVLACWVFGLDSDRRLRWTVWGLIELPRNLSDGLNWWQAAALGLVFGGIHAAAHVPSFVAKLTFAWAAFWKFRVARGEARERHHTAERVQEFEQDAKRARRRAAAEFRAGVWALFTGLVSGFVGGLLLYVVIASVLWRLHGYPLAIATVGPPLAFLIFSLASFLEVGLMGTLSHEGDREWWGRLSAWVLIYAFVWLVVFGVGLFGAELLRVAGGMIRTVLAAGWVTTALAGVFAGRSPRTGTGRGNWILEIVGKIGPPAFIVGLLAALSLLADTLVVTEPLPDAASQPPGATKPGHHRPGTTIATATATATATTTVTATATATAAKTVSDRSLQLVLHTDPWKLLRWLGAFSFLTCFAARCVDVNEFSMHAMYANRLVRCYLGASRLKPSTTPPEIPAVGGVPGNQRGSIRRPNPITGFDPRDDMALCELQIGRHVSGQNEEQRYWGPFPLINTALNLVGGKELAWQERKAESFVLTPLYCGSETTGYRKLPEFAENLNLGTAVAISGAAASPNMGYHSSPAITALMTIFNVRLGWWLGNPARKKWAEAGPNSGHLYLLTELFSQTNAERSYVYLSDGGHFENLGVYELVRRRCRYIVVCDAGADPTFDFYDLGSLARKCRTDLGVDIEIDLSQLRPSPEDRRSRWHCAIGTIRYDYVDPQAPVGTLVYLKPALTGDEPPDVLHYATEHSDFPHEPTLDQFFSESQFESYRALGYHTVRKVFEQAAEELPPSNAHVRPPATVPDSRAEPPGTDR